jgi:CheY-like chemotaxis protein
MVILVVDDNPVSARLVERVLQSEGYGTIAAGNGLEALERLETTADVRLVVCDLRMPEMDGLQFVEELRKRPVWKDLPVLMCTSVGEAASVKEAIRLGVKSYVRKPVSAMVLLDKVRDLIDARPVLRERREVMRALGFEPRMNEAYDDLAQQFARLVNARLEMLLEMLDSDGPTADLPLEDLAESAQLLGAERLLSVIQRITGGNVDSGALRTEYAFLTKELKLLQTVLPETGSPDPVESVTVEGE